MVQLQFSLELKNRFSLLQEDEESVEMTAEKSVEEEWTSIRNTIKDCAQHAVGYRRGTKKEQLISSGTWKATNERRVLKAKKEQACHTGIQLGETN
jgi:hypothetical protein